MPRARQWTSTIVPLTVAACTAFVVLASSSAVAQRLMPRLAIAAAPGLGAYWWDKVPEITISTRPDDPRIRLVHEGAAFWNRLLLEIGTPFRLGPVAETNQLVPAEYLERLSESVAGTGGVLPDDPAEVRHIPGDLIVALSVSPLISFSTLPRPARRVLVVIRTDRIPPLSLPNVARNTIAHELGHAIGLGHNSDPTMLMCGRPAACRPNDFASRTERYFPVSDAEKAYLLQRYPRDWKPSR